MLKLRSYRQEKDLIKLDVLGSTNYLLILFRLRDSLNSDSNHWLRIAPNYGYDMEYGSLLNI